ncbi:MAG: TrkA family potassium uptake protein [Deltaproteobacteria bacterium]|nr:TrkA family potassium uptake protein [Deltaproteobacteria bacterium]
MNVMIVGCGRVGAELATSLSMAGSDVVVVDREPESFRRLGSTFNGITATGYGFDEDLLREAGIERCDAFAAVMDRDSSNMMAAEIALRIFRVPRVVARLYDQERERTFQQLGLDYVCVTTRVAQALLDKMVAGHGRHLTTRGGIELIEFIAGRAVDTKRLVDIQIPNQFRVCLVTRDGSSFIPWRETILKEGDILLAVVQDAAYPKVKPYMLEP